MTTKVKEKPILFSGPMVRAILEGRKTQTRRVVKPQPPNSIDDLHGGELSARAPYPLEDYESGNVFGYGFQDDNGQSWKCPCPPGMRLWVRETFAFAEAENGAQLVVYRADGAIADVYQLDDGPPSLNGFRSERWDDSRHGKLSWKPSIFMPRWASRITLEVTASPIGRLQDISEADAIAEGLTQARLADRWLPGNCDYPQWAFEILWDSINAKSHPWASNPWVWVIEFRRDGQ